MGNDWGIYAIAIGVLIVIWSVVFVIPALLVKFRIISDAEPVVNDKRPIARDWILTVLAIAAAFAFVIPVPDVAIIAAVLVYFIAGPWWIWRSVKSLLYARQHLHELTPSNLLSLVLTSAFTYIFALAIIQELQ